MSIGQARPDRVGAPGRASPRRPAGVAGAAAAAGPSAQAVRARLSATGTVTRLASGLGRLGPPLGLLLMTVAVFWRDLFGGMAYFGGDTVSFYYPLTTWYAAQLHQGELPLWFPYIFGGYPLFADGEIGMLYPLNLVAYSLLPADLAFVWLRPLHLWLAGLFSYWLARLLGAGRFGAFIAGLAFSYGSFLVGHIQHDNILRSAVWLPLALGLLELGMRAGGRERAGWLVACGAVLGVQMLGVHVQPVLLSILALGAYALFAPLRVGASPSGRLFGSIVGWLRRPEWRRAGGWLAARGLAVGLLGAVGLGLGAVQLLPLYQLAERSVRFDGASYEFATSYSVPPTQLIQLVLPYLFRADPHPYWGLWSATETTLYVGIAPLILAAVALAYLRSRAVLFFGLLAAVSLLLTLGDYLPLKLYGLISSLPGFSFLRVPARFSLLFTLAVGILAGFGADWLAGRAFDRHPDGHPRPRVRRLLLVAFGLGLAGLLLAAIFIVARVWLESDARSARQLIEAYYLSLRRGDLGLSPSRVYFGLLRALDLGNFRTQLGILLMVGCSVAVLLRAYHLMPRRAWQGLVMALVMVDLALFAQGFYPQKPIGELRLSYPSIKFLTEHNGLHRVLVEPLLNGLLGPNQLVAHGIDTAGGYSSLEPRRASEYWWGMVNQDNVLLDLYNVRYVVAPRHTPGLLSFEGTLYHPADRLMRGSVNNPSGAEAFSIRPAWTEALTVVAAAEGVRDLPYGVPLAEITLSGPQGEQHLELRAGEHVDESSAPLFGPPAPELQRRPRIVWAGAAFQNPRQLSALSGVSLPLAEPMMVTGVTIKRTGPPSALNVYGLGLHDRMGLPVRSISPVDRAKYRLVYEDLDARILENTAALPRAFLVGSARTAAPTIPMIDQMLLGSFDPRQTILVEGGGEQAASPEVPAGGPGAATVVEYRPDRVVVEVEAEAAGYLVLTDRYDEGWRVRVDGQDAALLRADAIFRAVPVQPGRSTVVFSYEPLGLLPGAAISLGTSGLVCAVLLWGVLSRRRRRAPPVQMAPAGV